MLPHDIATCLPLCDIYEACLQRGLATELEKFLIGLMLDKQMWGSLIRAPGELLPVCFGTGIFISDTLATRLLAGQHPFLLLDLCENQHNLRSHILDWEEVQSASKQGRLNFCGGIFCFARALPPAFFTAMDLLQLGLLRSMSGFGLQRYFKHTYEPRAFVSQLKSFGMRKKFGARTVIDYDKHRDPCVGQFGVRLFTATKEEAGLRFSKPICQLMCPEPPRVEFSFQSRMLLRLEIEDSSAAEIAGHLGIEVSTIKSTWDTIIKQVRKNKVVTEYLGLQASSSKNQMRDRIREYVRSRPQELGVLPPLTPFEENSWKLAQAPEETAIRRPEVVVTRVRTA